MKKIAKAISLFLAMIFIFAGMSVSVYAAGESALTIKVYDDMAVVTSCLPTATGVVDIPSQKDGVPVVMISGAAFEDCNKITQVNIPSSITKIGDNAFENCIMLTKVVFEGENCEIGNAAFKTCGLTDITLPSGLKKIADETFYDCAALVSIEIPETVEVIGSEAFRICKSLARVDIPASVEVIKKNAFLGCTSVTEYNVAAGNGVYTSADGVLYGPYQSQYDEDVSSPVTDKTLIQYPAGNAAVGYTVQQGTVIIGDCAFGSSKNLSSVTLPSGLKTIDAYAFNESSVAQVNIPSTVTKIGKQAFAKCASLKNITIPASVTNFDSAFYMSGIENVTIASGVKTVSSKAFEGCTSLANVSIPSSVTSIGAGAFYGCSSLGEIEIPASVTSIGNLAFEGCRNVTLVVEENSAAHTYASANDINYRLKNDSDEPTTNPGTQPTTKPTTKPDESKTIVKITVDRLPTKTNYYYKETVDASGMRLEVIYSDGSSEIVTEGYKISPTECTERGVQTVKVEYKGFSAGFEINVSFAWWQWVIWILLLGFIWY